MSVSPATEPDISDAVVRWLVPGRVIYVWARGDVSTSVRTWMNTRVIYLYHSCSTPKVHILLDIRQVTGRPKCTRDDRPAVWHPRRGWIVSLGAVSNPLLRLLINKSIALMRLDYMDCPTAEEGLKGLQAADPTLPDLQPYWEQVTRASGEGANRGPYG